MLRRLPLTLKALLAAVVVGAAVWYILDFWQTAHLKTIFQARLKEVVGEKALINRVVFDHNIKLHHQAVKLLAARSSLIDFVNTFHPGGKRVGVSDREAREQPVPDGSPPTERIIYHRHPPQWLPKASVLRGMAALRYLLLLGMDGTVWEVYQGQPEQPPQALLEPSPMLRQLSHDQTFLTTIGGQPFLIASEPVLDSSGHPLATLMLANPLDDAFLSDHQQTSSPYTGIVALLEGDDPRVIASNDSHAIPPGATLEKVMGRYLVAGQSFFDYGASDLLIQLVTLVDAESFESLSRSILRTERRQRLVTAIALILTSLLIVLWITRNLEQVTRNITDFSKNILGATPRISHNRDELFILREQFQNLAREIIRARDNLHAELVRRQEAEKEIRKLSHTVEQSPVAVMITDENGHITYVNPQFCRLTGYSSEEVLGNDSRFLRSGETPESAYKNMWETISSGGVWHGEFSNRRKDGTIYWESNIISRFLDPDEMVPHYLAIKEDISPRIEMERAMRQAREAAEAANQVKNDLLNNISHELRTPLHTITGCTNLLLGKEFGEFNKVQKKYLRNVLAGADQLFMLLSDLLDLSKVTTEQFILEERFFDLPELVESTNAMIAAHAREKGLAFACSIDPDIPARVKGDPVRLRQLLIHLLRNAIKFTPKGEVRMRLTRETVHCNHQPGSVCFIITDTGIGIPEELQQSIFDPFTQADTSSSRPYEGTGLGLAIAKNLIDLMGGRIQLQSKVDVGSAFFVSIPFEVPDARSDGGPDATHSLPRGLHTVVAGKNPVNRLILKKLLISLGLEVTELAQCRAVEELLAAVGTHPPDLLCLDCSHSASGGIEEIRQIRNTPALQTLPILLFSSVSDAMRSQSTQLIGIHFLSRPIQRDQLLETVQQALSERAGDREAGG